MGGHSLGSPLLQVSAIVAVTFVHLSGLGRAGEQTHGETPKLQNSGVELENGF